MLSIKKLISIFKNVFKKLKKLITKNIFVSLMLLILLLVITGDNTFHILEGIADKLKKKDKRTVHQNLEDPQSSKLMIPFNKAYMDAQSDGKYDDCYNQYKCDGKDSSTINSVPYTTTECMSNDGDKLHAKDPSDCARQKRLSQNNKQTNLINKQTR